MSAAGATAGGVSECLQLVQLQEMSQVRAHHRCCCCCVKIRQVSCYALVIDVMFGSSLSLKIVDTGDFHLLASFDDNTVSDQITLTSSFYQALGVDAQVYDTPVSRTMRHKSPGPGRRAGAPSCVHREH